jgi:hypothetical protein
MRNTIVCVFILFAATLPNRAADMVVILEFDGPYSERAVTEMKHETEAAVKDAKLNLDWQLKTDAGHNAFHDLVVVKFKGKCRFEPAAYMYDERGPLAFTYSTSGEVQPFSEVSCDNVAAAIRPAMSGGEYRKADLLMGRALGRVLAHELMHMLTHSGAHGQAGAGKPALSGRQLIADELPLEPADVERILEESRKH